MINISDYKNAERVFYYFERISEIPRASGNSDGIAEYLAAFAKERGLYYKRDAKNNVIIKKPATEGKEGSPTVIIQGHTDIVADKEPWCEKDMSRDGLEIYRDGDFIKARGTTLGADNGIAVAYALALLEADDIPHPPIEALFTSDEEIGLLGAMALDATDLTGRLLINIDSDVEGEITAGCAGGVRADATIPINKTTSDSPYAYRLRVSGLRGGHSGTEINKGCLNAIKILHSLLVSLGDLMIADISAGSADNAIPHSAEAIFTADIDEGKFAIEMEDVANELMKSESNIIISLESVGGVSKICDADSTERLLSILGKMPTGVYKMSEDIEGLVETSSNLAIVSLTEDLANITVSVRSSKNAEREALYSKVAKIAEAAGGSCKARSAYPAWEFKKESRLRECLADSYREFAGEPPRVISIHAGLECGILSEKIEGLDAVSFGPNAFDGHTTAERLSVSSAARVWEVLKLALSKL